MPQTGYDIDQIISDFGNYYLNNGQNKQRLLRQLRADLAFDELFTTAVTRETKWQGSEVRTQEMLQPWQKGWTPKGSSEFKPIEIFVEKMKVDIDIMPDDIHESWLGFLEGKSDQDRRNWPFVRYLVEEEWIPQMREDYELEVMFSGVKAAVTPGTPGAAADSLDGVNQLRKYWNAQGRLDGVQAVGAPPVDPKLFVEYVHDMVGGINSRYRFKSGILAASQDLELRYRTGFIEKYGTSTSINETQNTRILNHKMMIKGYEAMQGSDVLFYTPKYNLIHLKSHISNDSNFRLETLKRVVFAHTHIHRGIGIRIPELMFTNDVDIL